MASEAQIRITVDSSQAERALGNLQNTLKGLAAITIGSGVIASLGKIAVEAQTITNKLLSVSDSLDEANGKFYMIGQTAMKTGSSIGGTADLYQKLAMSATFAGSSTDALLKVTENFNKTLQISGASGAGAAAALYQFAQAAQKGTLNGDEFRSMAETNGYMLKLLSKELNISQTELRQMASDGKLSMELIGKALLNSKQLTEDYAKAVKTVPQAWENVKTSLMMSVKALDDATGASNAVAKALQALADNMPIVIAAVTALGTAFLIINVGAIVAGIRAITVAMVGLAVTMGPIGLAVTALAGIAAYVGMNKVIDDAKKKTEELNNANKAGLVVNHQRTQEALDLDKALQQTIASMNAASTVDLKSNGMRSMALEIEKALAAEKVKYLKTGEQMTPKLEAEFKAAVKNKITAEEHSMVMKQRLQLQSQAVTNAMVDADQQSIATQMESFRLSVTKERYDLEKNSLKTQLERNQAIAIETQYKRMTAPEAKSQVANRAGSIFSGTQEGLDVEYKRQRVALDELKVRGLINDQSYADQEVLINQTKNEAMLANEQKLADARMRLNGVTNQAIIDAVKAQMANVKMIQSGGIAGAQGVLGAMDQVFGAMASTNKAAFETHKKLAIAQAVISTYQAAAMAIAMPPGPPLSFIYVAGAIAAGLAQVGAIKSQTYSGRALGGPVMGNKPYIVGERGPELFTPNNSGSITRNQDLGGGGTTNVNFTIVANDSTGFDNLLNSRKGMIKQLISDAMLDKGQRF
jgi:tape measure domain-containing protein